MKMRNSFVSNSSSSSFVLVGNKVNLIRKGEFDLVDPKNKRYVIKAECSYDPPYVFEIKNDMVNVFHDHLNKILEYFRNEGIELYEVDFYSTGDEGRRVIVDNDIKKGSSLYYGERTINDAYDSKSFIDWLESDGQFSLTDSKPEPLYVSYVEQKTRNGLFGVTIVKKIERKVVFSDGSVMHFNGYKPETIQAFERFSNACNNGIEITEDFYDKD